MTERGDSGAAFLYTCLHNGFLKCVVAETHEHVPQKFDQITLARTV